MLPVTRVKIHTAETSPKREINTVEVLCTSAPLKLLRGGGGGGGGLGAGNIIVLTQIDFTASVVPCRGGPSEHM